MLFIWKVHKRPFWPFAGLNRKLKKILRLKTKKAIKPIKFFTSKKRPGIFKPTLRML